jgi:hypothetical protein
VTRGSRCEERLGLAGLDIAFEAGDDLAPREAGVGELVAWVIVNPARVGDQQRRFTRGGRWLQLAGHARVRPVRKIALAEPADEAARLELLDAHLDLAGYGEAEVGELMRSSRTGSPAASARVTSV